MEMTYEQRQDYNKLTSSQKEDFKYNERKHPNWTFTQIMAKLALDEKGGEFIDRGGNNVNPTEPDTWLIILEGVKATLSKFQSIGRSIFMAIDSAIVSIRGLIVAGIKRVGDVIDNLFDKLF